MKTYLVLISGMVNEAVEVKILQERGFQEDLRAGKFDEDTRVFEINGTVTQHTVKKSVVFSIEE